jgi:hypothetical protein
MNAEIKRKLLTVAVLKIIQFILELGLLGFLDFVRRPAF